MSATAVDVSVVLPVFNEAEHIETEIGRIRTGLDASPLSFEIIAVDDGSTDGSREVLKGIDGIRVIELAENQGSGAARRIGTRAARGEVVVWTDVDLTYPNDEIPRLVKELNGADQVVGARTSEQGTGRLLRVPAKWMIRTLASYLVQTSIPDLNSGFRAFRRDVAAQFLADLPRGFSCVTTLTMSFLANGYSVKYTPIEYRRRAGRSKFHWWKDSRRYLLQVIRMALSYEPLRVFLPIGLLLGLVGTGKLVYDLAASDLKVAGNTLLLFVAAFVLLTVGLLADLVVRATRPRDLLPSAAVREVTRTRSTP